MKTTANFQAAWWLSNSHLQTLWPSFFRRLIPLSYNKERLELDDGDFVDLCWSGKNSGPIVVVFHGLEGNIDSPYANGIIHTLIKRGWCCLFMHFRGCSGEPNRLARSYHSGDTVDIEFLIQHLRRRHPDRNIFALGYSLGGNALLKYLGEKKRPEQPEAAVAVSVPFQLDNAATKLERGLSRIYQWHLVSRLKNKVKQKFKNTTPPVSFDRLKQLTTFYQFDDEVTAPVHGFKDVHDYYAKSSSKQFLTSITTPTLILHAADDPFMSQAAIPAENELSEYVTLELSRQGGHVGFISGHYPWQPVYWLEQRIADYFSECMTNIKNENR